MWLYRLDLLMIFVSSISKSTTAHIHTFLRVSRCRRVRIDDALIELDGGDVNIVEDVIAVDDTPFYRLEYHR